MSFIAERLFKGIGTSHEYAYRSLGVGVLEMWILIVFVSWEIQHMKIETIMLFPESQRHFME